MFNRVNFLLVLTCFVSLLGCGAGSVEAPSPAAVATQPTKLLSQVTVASPVFAIHDLSANYIIVGDTAPFIVRHRYTQVAVTLPADTLRVRFADVTIALHVDTKTAQIFRLYQAAFNRVPDQAGLGFWLAAYEAGWSLDRIAAAFIDSEEFRSTYANVRNSDDFVVRLYDNVLHRAPESSGRQFWIQALTDGLAKSSVLVYFADSSENKQTLAETIRTGIRFAELGVDYVPVAGAGVDQTVTTNTVVTLDGSSSSDVRLLGLGYRWVLTKPAGSVAILSADSVVKPLFRPEVPGTYSAKLSVNNGVSDSFEPATVTIIVRNLATVTPPTVPPLIIPIGDTGIFKCSTLSASLAQSLFAAGHRYLDRDNDGKPCEVSDILAEASTGTGPVVGGKRCYVNGYYRKNGTYVKGYYRSC